ncbi:MAG: hypothetical protein KIG60_10065, partial [Caryophanon sp.]|nr:hypothetical protein [Caryophanon sp.]
LHGFVMLFLHQRDDLPVNGGLGFRGTGKGSSVDIFSVFSLWNPFSNEKGHIDHIPGKVWISWGSFSALLMPLFALPASAGGICKG